MHWRNDLYKAGYTEALAHPSHQRLLPLGGVEAETYLPGEASRSRPAKPK